MSAVMKIASWCFALFLAFCGGCSPVTGLPPEQYELKQCVSRCDSKKVLSPLSEERRSEIEPLRDFHVRALTKNSRPVAIIDQWGGFSSCRWRTFLLFEKEIVCIDFGRHDKKVLIKNFPLSPETCRSLKEKLHRLESFPGETCLAGADIPMGLFTVGCGGRLHSFMVDLAPYLLKASDEDYGASREYLAAQQIFYSVLEVCNLFPKVKGNGGSKQDSVQKHVPAAFPARRTPDSRN